MGGLPDSERIIKRIRDSLKGIDNLPEGWSRDTILDVYMHAFRAAFCDRAGSSWDGSTECVVNERTCVAQKFGEEEE